MNISHKIEYLNVPNITKYREISNSIVKFLDFLEIFFFRLRTADVKSSGR